MIEKEKNEDKEGFEISANKETAELEDKEWQFEGKKAKAMSLQELLDEGKA